MISRRSTGRGRARPSSSRSLPSASMRRSSIWKRRSRACTYPRPKARSASLAAEIVGNSVGVDDDGNGVRDPPRPAPPLAEGRRTLGAVAQPAMMTAGVTRRQERAARERGGLPASGGPQHCTKAPARRVQRCADAVLHGDCQRLPASHDDGEPACRGSPRCTAGCASGAGSAAVCSAMTTAGNSLPCDLWIEQA